jgi:hypothetical protein
MTRQQSYRSGVVLILSVLLSGISPKALGQVRQRDMTQSAGIPPVTVFKGGGRGPAKAPLRRLPPPQTPLSPQSLSSVLLNQFFMQLGGKPVSEYCKVTPQHPHVADRCFLQFDTFYSLRTDENMAIAFYEPASLYFYVKPAAAGKKYFIDCRVHALDKQPFDVYASFDASVSALNGHLILALDTTDADLTYVLIYRKDASPFYFYGCTATEYVLQVKTFPK